VRLLCVMQPCPGTGIFVVEGGPPLSYGLELERARFGTRCVVVFELALIGLCTSAAKCKNVCHAGCDTGCSARDEADIGHGS
jgi:hypothetical protein